MEYQGYGFCKEPQPNITQLKLNAMNLLNFVISNLEYDLCDIILCGKGFGTGLALHLAEQFDSQGFSKKLIFR